MAVAVSLVLALVIVPRQVKPWTGLLLMYEWTFTLFILFFGGYLYLVYLWGKTTALQAGSFSSNPESYDYDSGKGLLHLSTCIFKMHCFMWLLPISYCHSLNWLILICISGHQRQGLSCDVVTCCYGLGMAFLAVAAPSLPCVLGITALFAR